MLRLFFIICWFIFFEGNTGSICYVNFTGNIGFICAAISVKTHKSLLSSYHEIIIPTLKVSTKSYVLKPLEESNILCDR